MTKRLVRHGNSWALVLDKTMRQLLGINEHNVLDLTIEGKVLSIRAAQGDENARAFEEALEKANQRYGKMLKRLAE